MTTKSAQKRMFLLDGMGLVYRAFYSFAAKPLINSRGENTSAVFGFVNYLNKILDEHVPDYIAVVFDTDQPTFRHIAYAEYKATRAKMPEDIAARLPILKEVISAYHIPTIELHGYEADDIIGTLARRAEHENVETYMVTSDKDFMQLVSPLIKIYRPGKAGNDDEVLDETAVLNKFGVCPERVIDVLGLMGDQSDNVPGVPGIGEKTAIPLVQKYGTMENVYSHLEEIPQKGVRDKLRTHHDLALLSKNLVTIFTSVPVAIDFHTLRARDKNLPALLALFEHLEFSSLIRRVKEQIKRSGATTITQEYFKEDMDSAHSVITSDDTSSAGKEHAATGESDLPVAEMPIHAGPGADIHLPMTNIRTDEHTYIVVDSDAAYLRLLTELKNASAFVFDTETTSANSLRAELVGVAFCIEPRTAYYIPVHCERADETTSLFDTPVCNTNSYNIRPDQFVKDMGSIFSDPRIKKYGQNIKYDMLVLSRYGIDVQGATFDTMVASYVLRPDGKHGLDALALEHLHYTMISFDELTDNGKKDIRSIPYDIVGNYSAEDADMTYRLTDSMYTKLSVQGMQTLCTEIEFPLIEVLTDMEKTGIAIDIPFLRTMSQTMDKQLKLLIEHIYTDAGGEFNINSTQQLAQILFTKLKLKPTKKTKTGFSTDVGVLEALQKEHPIVAHMLEYRQLQKLKSTYVDALPKLIHPKTGRVHTSYNQTVAATGRLSSSDPNLQNIPIRTEMGREIRRAFIPGATGMKILSADYSQIELRVMAHISQDEGFLAAFHAGEDIHSSTAAKVFNVAQADVTKDMRRKAKEVNFGIMYGLGAFGLASRLDIPQSEAKEIIEKYFERFPNVKKYIAQTIDFAREHGYVETLNGRRRYLPDIQSRNRNISQNAERQAINMPIQGTSADMIKRAMIDIFRALREQELKSKMLLQVHDELVFEVYEEEENQVRTLVENKMKHALSMNVPIEVEIGVGINWLEAH